MNLPTLLSPNPMPAWPTPANWPAGHPMPMGGHPSQALHGLQAPPWAQPFTGGQPLNGAMHHPAQPGYSTMMQAAMPPMDVHDVQAAIQQIGLLTTLLQEHMQALLHVVTPGGGRGQAPDFMTELAQAGPRGQTFEAPPGAPGHLNLHAAMTQPPRSAQGPGTAQDTRPPPQLHLSATCTGLDESQQRTLSYHPITLDRKDPDGFVAQLMDAYAHLQSQKKPEESARLAVTCADGAGPSGAAMAVLHQLSFIEELQAHDALDELVADPSLMARVHQQFMEGSIETRGNAFADGHDHFLQQCFSALYEHVQRAVSAQRSNATLAHGPSGPQSEQAGHPRHLDDALDSSWNVIETPPQEQTSPKRLAMAAEEQPYGRSMPFDPRLVGTMNASVASYGSDESFMLDEPDGTPHSRLDQSFSIIDGRQDPFSAYASPSRPARSMSDISTDTEWSTSADADGSMNRGSSVEAGTDRDPASHVAAGTSTKRTSSADASTGTDPSTRADASTATKRTQGVDTGTAPDRPHSTDAATSTDEPLAATTAAATRAAVSSSTKPKPASREMGTQSDLPPETLSAGQTPPAPAARAAESRVRRQLPKPPLQRQDATVARAAKVKVNQRAAERLRDAAIELRMKHAPSIATAGSAAQRSPSPTGAAAQADLNRQLARARRLSDSEVQRSKPTGPAAANAQAVLPRSKSEGDLRSASTAAPAASPGTTAPAPNVGVSATVMAAAPTPTPTATAAAAAATTPTPTATAPATPTPTPTPVTSAPALAPSGAPPADATAAQATATQTAAPQRSTQPRSRSMPELRELETMKEIAQAHHVALNVSLDPIVKRLSASEPSVWSRLTGRVGAQQASPLDEQILLATLPRIQDIRNAYRSQTGTPSDAAGFKAERRHVQEQLNRSVSTLVGGLSAPERKRLAQRFQQADGPRSVLTQRADTLISTADKIKHTNAAVAQQSLEQSRALHQFVDALRLALTPANRPAA